jgi:hypothetical protein
MDSSSLFIEASDVKNNTCIDIFHSEVNNQNDLYVSSFDPKESDIIIDSSTSFYQQSNHSLHVSNIISCSKRKIIDLSSDSEIRETSPDNKIINPKKIRQKLLILKQEIQKKIIQ